MNSRHSTCRLGRHSFIMQSNTVNTWNYTKNVSSLFSLWGERIKQMLKRIFIQPTTKWQLFIFHFHKIEPRVVQINAINCWLITFPWCVYFLYVAWKPKTVSSKWNEIRPLLRWANKNYKVPFVKSMNKLLQYNHVMKSI